MRVKYQRAPITTEWTVGAKANTGDGILAAEKLGAALEIMEDAWWGPTVPLVGAPWFALSERNSPGLDHREHVGQAVHERVDALRRGRATTCTAASTARARVPARTSRPG